MIFVTVGNWHRGFDRLVKAVDRLKGQNIIQQDVIAQVGAGCYKPVHLGVIEYCSPTEFTDFVAKSKLVITHAGIGSIGQAIELGKPIVVVPRKAEVGECSDNHQWITAKQLEKEGQVLVAYETNNLPGKIKQAENFVPTQKQDNQKIIQAIETFLKELVIKKCGASCDE